MHSNIFLFFEKWSLKIKWTIQFLLTKNILLVQDQGYDDYRTPDSSRIDAETSFTEPTTTEATSTLCLRQRLKRDKKLSHYTDTLT